MTQTPKRKLKNIDFSNDTSHIALVSKQQGGPANGANYSLVLKNLKNPSQEFIEKIQGVQVEMELPDFLSTFFCIWGEDAEFLASLMGYVEPPEDDQAEAQEDYQDWVEDRFQSFNIIKSLHEAESLPEALSKITEQEYLTILNDQVEIEKALTEFANKKANASTKNVGNTKVGASASKKVTKGKQMATPEMVEKEKLTAVEKALNDQTVALEKALAQVKQFENEKKEAIVKSKTNAVKAVVKNEAQAAAVVKAALALDNQEDFDALLAVFKSMNELLEKSGLFHELGVSAEASEDISGETKLMKALKARHQVKQ